MQYCINLDIMEMMVFGLMTGALDECGGTIMWCKKAYAGVMKNQRNPFRQVPLWASKGVVLSTGVSAVVCRCRKGRFRIPKRNQKGTQNIQNGTKGEPTRPKEPSNTLLRNRVEQILKKGAKRRTPRCPVLYTNL